MKGRESGMPEKAYWNTFFQAEQAVDLLLGSAPIDGNVVEMGCGYGTFTFAAARRTTGTVHALDIEADLIASLQCDAKASAVSNIRAEVRDFVAHGTGLAPASQAHVMIYNLLHLDDPVSLLQEAQRVLRPDGTLSVMHWRSDIPTPRGPSLAIRPSPEQCMAWMQKAGFCNIQSIPLTGYCPYHFGLVATRRGTFP